MLNLHEFESKSTGEIKPVDCLEAGWNQLVTMMKSAKSVEHWNELREIAKEEFAPALICRLDKSGLLPSLKVPRV
jgi:hypothetical protein